MLTTLIDVTPDEIRKLVAESGLPKRGWTLLTIVVASLRLEAAIATVKLREAGLSSTVTTLAVTCACRAKALAMEKRNAGLNSPQRIHGAP